MCPLRSNATSWRKWPLWVHRNTVKLTTLILKLLTLCLPLLRLYLTVSNQNRNYSQILFLVVAGGLLFGGKHPNPPPCRCMPVGPPALIPSSHLRKSSGIVHSKEQQQESCIPWSSSRDCAFHGAAAGIVHSKEQRQGPGIHTSALLLLALC